MKKNPHHSWEGVHSRAELTIVILADPSNIPDCLYLVNNQLSFNIKVLFACFYYRSRQFEHSYSNLLSPLLQECFRSVSGYQATVLILNIFNYSGLRVLSLNVWGMPALVGALDKELRISAIGDFVQKAEYDIYLFSEVPT